MNTNKLNVGDVVILRKNGSTKPETTNVDSVTAAGNFRVYAAPGILFSGDRWADGYAPREKRRDEMVYLYTEEKLAEVMKRWNDNAAAAEAKKVEREEAHKKAAERHAAELVEVKLAMGGFMMVRAREVMPDGSRIFWVNLPIKPSVAERKVGFEVMFVRLKDVEDYDWDAPSGPDGHKKVKKVELVYSYLNGGSCSFASVSAEKCGSDEEALWEAARRLYYSW